MTSEMPPSPAVPPTDLGPDPVTGLQPSSSESTINESFTRDEVRQLVQQHTPARIFVDRSGPGYRTATQLELRRDHAVALDAVHAELEPAMEWGDEFLDRFRLFTVQSQAESKAQYLMRPDFGRRFTGEVAALLQERCPPAVDFQVVIGDGLSSAAVARQIPQLLPELMRGAQARGWSIGRPFIVRYCRVGILNEVGELLQPQVVVLLIGERPGLATAESLSAYFAYRPGRGHTDAQRNLISNIHDRGLAPASAIPRILELASQLRTQQISGISIKERLASALPDPASE